MRTILVFVALLGLGTDLTMAAASVDEGAKKPVTGYDFLKQHKYREARIAYEAGLKQHPANTMAHFYLGDTCRGLKDWVCAEAHYETALELDGKSSVAGLATLRRRTAKVWRLLDEGKQAITELNAPPTKVAQATDTLDIANKLGLDDEQRALYQQLQEKIQQRHTQVHETTAASQHQTRSMALVPTGEFTMGSAMGSADEQPEHRVSVGAFYMDLYQVSIRQYARFVEATHHDVPPDWSVMNRPQHYDRPIANVDWADAVSFCQWAGKRLPTEAEWEKAARGTDGRTYPWGNVHPTRLHATAGKEVWSNHSALTPGGMLEEGKSPYGIYDMAGNVWEWVSDWYDQDYYKTSPPQNPTGPSTGWTKVVRGGSWGSNADGLRSAEREAHVPTFRGFGTGFRCAKTL